MANFDLTKKIRNKQARLGVIGLGYVGLPLAIHFKELGYQINGFDIDEEKIKQLNNGESYINHIQPDDISKLNTNGKFATSNFQEISNMDIIFVCVPTPIDEQRNPYMGHLIDTAKSLSKYLSKGHLVLIESSTYPGTTNELIKPILEESGLICHKDFYLGYSPEREDPGNKNFNIKNISKVVGADDATSLKLSLEIYSKLTKTFPMKSSYEAEAVKLTENIFRSINIALVNELKIIYDHMDIDVWNVIDGASTKPFGFMPFYPGPGIGGHCIPVDPFYLTFKAREHSLATKFIELAGDINSSMPLHVVRKCQNHLNMAKKSLNGSKILVCGLAYKKNVDDMRESPSLEIMKLLTEFGAEIEYHDPYINKIPKLRNFQQFENVDCTDISPENLKDVDLTIICTDHDIVDYDTIVENSPLVIDTRNCLKTSQYSKNVIKA
tara:strand:- start:2669 stop:3985 length:1317 start_codon:yes stop_codon:yes gene_type:complete